MNNNTSSSSNNNNNASSAAIVQDTTKALTSLQHAIRLCRPQNVINFAIRYLQDEQRPISTNTTTNTTNNNASSSSSSLNEENHAIHMLPFLISQSEEFCNAACTIFCAQQQHSITIMTPGTTTAGANSSDLTMNSSNNNSNVNLLEGTNGLPPPAPSTNSTTTTTRKYYREYLDASHVLDILNYIDFQNNYRLSHPLIDDYITERIEKLRRIDFDLFVSSLRFVIGCYQIMAYIKDEMYDYLKVYETSTVELPIPDDMNIDVIKWKTFMMK